MVVQFLFQAAQQHRVVAMHPLFVFMQGMKRIHKSVSFSPPQKKGKSPYLGSQQPAVYLAVVMISQPRGHEEVLLQGAAMRPPALCTAAGAMAQHRTPSFCS